jgi:hypothetical protein
MDFTTEVRSATVSKKPLIQSLASKRLICSRSLRMEKAKWWARGLLSIFYTANPASPWAKFSIGQRDVNPFTLKVKMLAIEGQLYDSELTNPLTLLVGNLDASFVFLFLFPLLIIAFTYNAISEEQENGVWKIVRTNTKNISAVILNKLLIRLVIILIVSLVVFITASDLPETPILLPYFSALAGDFTLRTFLVYVVGDGHFAGQKFFVQCYHAGVCLDIFMHSFSWHRRMCL